MQSKTKKILKIVASVLLIIIICLTSLGFWLYHGPLTDAKIKAFSLLPFPIALVNGRPIAASQFILRYNLAQTMMRQDFSGQPTNVISAGIISQLITEQKTGLLATQEGVDVTSKQLDDEYAAESLTTDLEGKSSFNQLLQSYGISPETYKNEVIEPQLLLANLQTWFYSQANLNTTSYAQANSLADQIQNGADMGALAASSTEDSSGQDTQGDLGFVDITQLLPELRESVGNMKVGDVKVIASRYGLNIIKLEAQNGNQLHLRQIFLQGADFQMWYNNETKGYSVEQLIKI
jgi:parvulin-like peptidyl-prolyl isomerase